MCLATTSSKHHDGLSSADSPISDAQYAHVLAQRCLGRNGSIGQREHHSPFRGANGIRITVRSFRSVRSNHAERKQAVDCRNVGHGACGGVLASSGLVRERFILAYEEVQNRSGKYTSIGNRVYYTKILRYLSPKNPTRPAPGPGPITTRFAVLWISRRMPWLQIGHCPSRPISCTSPADHGLLGLAVYLSCWQAWFGGRKLKTTKIGFC